MGYIFACYETSSSIYSMAIVDQLECLWFNFHMLWYLVTVVLYGYIRPVGLFVGYIFTCYGSSNSIVLL